MRQGEEGICAGQQVELGARRQGCAKPRQRGDRVIGAAARRGLVDGRGGKLRVAGRKQREHRKAVGEGCRLVRFKRLAADRGKQHLVERQAVAGGERDAEVAEMRGIERAAEEREAHRADCSYQPDRDGWTSAGALTASTCRTKMRPKTRATARPTEATAGTAAGSGNSSASAVTSRSAMPQGTMSAKSRRSVEILNAKPCEVMPRETWTPMAASFRFGNRATRKRPDAGAARDPPGGHAVLACDADQHFLKPAHIVDHAQASAVGELVPAEVEDGIADQLPGAVIGDVAAALDRVHVDAARGQFSIGGRDEAAPAADEAAAAQGEHRRMLEQQQHIADLAGAAQLDELLLQLEGAEVIGTAELEQGEQVRHGWDRFSS